MDNTLNILAYGGIALLVILLVVLRSRKAESAEVILHRTEDMSITPKVVRHLGYDMFSAPFIRYMFLAVVQ